jgi:hypothetical protein
MVESRKVQPLTPQKARTKRKTPTELTQTDPFSVGLELQLSADGFQEAGDYFCQLALKVPDTEQWHIAAQTETTQSDKSPMWQTEFDINYAFHNPLMLRFEIYREHLDRKDVLMASCELS